MSFRNNFNLATLKNQSFKEMNYFVTFFKVNMWRFLGVKICSALYFSVNLGSLQFFNIQNVKSYYVFQPKRGGMSSFRPISVSFLNRISGREYRSQAGLTKFLDIRTTFHLAHCCVISHISVTFFIFVTNSRRMIFTLLDITSLRQCFLYLTGQSLLSQVLFMVSKNCKLAI